MITVDKMILLKEYYFRDSFCSYRGTIFPTKPNSKGIYLPFAKNSYSKPKFWLDKELKSHLAGMTNIAGVMNDFDVDFMGWDIDGKAEEREEVKLTVHRVLALLHTQGLKTFTYESGGKGYHIEVKLNELIDFHRLKKLTSFVKRRFQTKGVKYIDRVYPSGAAYRLFGCCHYKTGNFTHAVNEDSLEPISEDESWERLQDYIQKNVSQNSIEKLYKLEQEYFEALNNGRQKETESVTVHKKKRTEQPEKRASGSKHDLKRIYEQGLNIEYRNRTGYGRYFTAYNLGRLFKHELDYDETEAKASIDNWLRQHYLTQCTSNQYFGDEAASCIESSYNECIQETIDNCMNGYYEGIPFGKQVCRIDLQKAKRHIAKQAVETRCLQAMTYLMKQCNVHRTMTIYQSYNQLKAGWRVGSSVTVKRILDKLYELKLIERIVEGSPMKKCNSLYKIILPDSCYLMEDKG